MRRVVHGIGLASVGVLLAIVLGYVALAVTRGISPPLAPIGSSFLGRYHRGDAVLVEAADHALERGDVAVARLGGHVQLVGVLGVDSGDPDHYFKLRSLENGDEETVARTGLIGVPGTRVPKIGWLLLIARARAGQVAFGIVVVLIALALVLTRERRVGFTTADIVPLQSRGPMLALPAGPTPDAATIQSPDAATPPQWAAGPADGTEASTPDTTSVALGVVPGALAVPYVGGLMSISPDELRQVRFAQSRRGYETSAVDRALDAVADTLEKLLHERVELIEQVKRLERESERLRGSEQGLTQALNAAKAEAEVVRAEAARLVSAAQGAIGAGANATGAGGDAATAQILGEMRAQRSLLQTLLTQLVNNQAPPAQQPAATPGEQPPAGA